MVAKRLQGTKEELFCLHYAENGCNGVQAAMSAGYTRKSARVMSSRLLGKAEVLARIKELIAERAERLCLSADSVTLRLVEIYERCMQERPVLAFNSESKEMEETGEYAFDSRGALRAAELLGRYLGMFSDRLKVEAVSDFAGQLQSARARVISAVSSEGDGHD